MKSFRGLFSLTLLLALCVSQAFAVSGSPGLPNLSTVRDLLNRANPRGDLAALGTQMVDHKVQLAKGTYRFATSGGASVVLPSTLLAKLKDVDGKDLVLPKNAVVKQVLVDALTAPAASASPGFTAPFLSLGVNSAADLKASLAAASWTGFMAGTPVGTAATMYKVTANSAVTINMTGGSITQGDLNVFIEYYLSN